MRGGHCVFVPPGPPQGNGLSAGAGSRGSAPGFTASTTNNLIWPPEKSVSVSFAALFHQNLTHRCGPDARSRAAMGHAKATTASPRCRLHCPSALPTLPNFCTLLAWRVPPCLHFCAPRILVLSASRVSFPSGSLAPHPSSASAAGPEPQIADYQPSASRPTPPDR